MKYGYVQSYAIMNTGLINNLVPILNGNVRGPLQMKSAVINSRF